MTDRRHLEGYRVYVTGSNDRCQGNLTQTVALNVSCIISETANVMFEL